MGNVTTTDDYSPALTAGGHAHATTTGNDAHATTAGFLSSAYASAGFLSSASAPGENAIAVAVGANSSARAADGGFIVLAQYNPDGDTVVAVKTTQVGRDGIKPDTWYSLGPTGEFVEAKVE